MYRPPSIESRSDNCCSRGVQVPEEWSFVDLEAPASLHEGYVFWASLGDHSFPVKVPVGGVNEGQTLRVPLLDSHLVEKKGKWKDGLFCCFRFGLFHPHPWVAWMCPQILLAQILTRMKMTWLAKPVPSKAPMQAMMGKVFVFFLLLSIYDAFAAPPLFEVTVNEKGDLILHQNLQYRWRQMIYVLVSLPMTIYGIMVVVKLRAAIRTKYGIPTGKLGKLEDWCYVCWCNCCVMSQLARQTADYDDEPATCCSSTGMKEPLHPSAHDDYLVPAVLL